MPPTLRYAVIPIQPMVRMLKKITSLRSLEAAELQFQPWTACLQSHPRNHHTL